MIKYTDKQRVYETLNVLYIRGPCIRSKLVVRVNVTYHVLQKVMKFCFENKYIDFIGDTSNAIDNDENYRRKIAITEKGIKYMKSME